MDYRASTNVEGERYSDRDLSRRRIWRTGHWARGAWDSSVAEPTWHHRSGLGVPTSSGSTRSPSARRPARNTHATSKRQRVGARFVANWDHGVFSRWAFGLNRIDPFRSRQSIGKQSDRPCQLPSRLCNFGVSCNHLWRKNAFRVQAKFIGQGSSP